MKNISELSTIPLMATHELHIKRTCRRLRANPNSSEYKRYEIHELAFQRAKDEVFDKKHNIYMTKMVVQRVNIPPEKDDPELQKKMWDSFNNPNYVRSHMSRIEDLTKQYSKQMIKIGYV